MNKLSFFYQPSQVYETTLRALERRRFAITEADEKQGIIKAVSPPRFLRPGVQLELKIDPVNDQLTSMNINSRMKKAWLVPSDYDATVESRFIRTLYNCFDMI
jgi:hypothetical protein